MLVRGCRTSILCYINYNYTIPTSIFLAWSLTAGSPSKTKCAVLSLMSLNELVFWGWWIVSLWTPLCCFVAIMNLFSQILEYCSPVFGQLLNVIFSFSSARCIRWWGFVLFRLSCRCVIDVMMLQCVCCTRLICSLFVQDASICFCQSSTDRSCGCRLSIRGSSIRV